MGTLVPASFVVARSLVGSLCYFESRCGTPCWYTGRRAIFRQDLPSVSNRTSLIRAEKDPYNFESSMAFRL